MKMTSFWKTLIIIVVSTFTKPLETLGEENIAWEKMSQSDIMSYFQIIKKEKNRKTPFF